MNLKSIWTTLEESSDILGDNYAYPAADKAAEELSLPANFHTWVTAIWLFDANPFSIAQFMRCFPYGLAQVNDERLASAVGQGYLDSDGQGVYRATESGKSAALRLILAGNEVMAALTPMPKESLRMLGNLLAQISDAAFDSPEPPAHVLIKAKRDLYERTGGLRDARSVILPTASCWKDIAMIAILPRRACTAWKIIRGKYSISFRRVTC